MKQKFFHVYYMKKIIPICVILLFTLLMLLRPQAALLSCSRALTRCAHILIPSLFPFFVCAALLVNLGFASYMTRFLTPMMRPIFHVPGCGALALFLGILSGYPIGASTVAQIYKNHLCTKTEAERMLAFCTNSGPMFLLGSIGLGIFHQQKIGILLYLSHLLSALIVGIIFRFYHTEPSLEPVVVKTISSQQNSLSHSIIEAVKSSCKNMLFVCGFVIMFNVFADLLILAPFYHSFRVIPSFVAGLVEVSMGAFLVGNLPFLSQTLQCILVSFLAGFGGLCVHMQVTSFIADTDLSLRPYYMGKILCGIFSAGIFILLLQVFPLPTEVFTALSPYQSPVVLSFENTLKLAFFYMSIAAISLVILYFVTLFLSRGKK